MSELNGFDPWSLPRPVLPQKTFTVKESGAELTLTLQALDVPRASQALAEAAPLISEFVIGEDGAAPNVYPIPGEAIHLTEEMVQNIATLRWMQLPAERRPFEWWLGVMLRMPRAYSRIWRAAQALIIAAGKDDSEDDSGNSLTASAVSASTTG